MGDQSKSIEGEGEDASQSQSRAAEYWRANLRVMGILLTVWFLASYGLGIFWVEWLNQFSLGGFPLGFWFSQQGSIYIFVALIFVYARWMDRIDAQFGVD